MNTTIIYYSDNKLDPLLFRKCQENIAWAADGKPIISVTQKPVDLGTNICVGEIGSSWVNLYKQVLTGAKNAQTQFVAMAEHDMFYTKEHFNWMPPRDDIFYYNENCMWVQWGGNHPELNGMYSTWWGKEPRFALSQLICNRELLIKDTEYRLKLLEDNDWLTKTMLFAGEPGVTRLKEIQKWAKLGKGLSVMQHLRVYHEVDDYFKSQKSEAFRTEQPNLDVRHGDNYTGPKRGKNRTYYIEPWGDFKKMMEM